MDGQVIRAGAVALALLFFGCSEEPYRGGFSCLEDESPPVCIVAPCPGDADCFQQERAHCFRNGPSLVCAPGEPECLMLRERAAEASQELLGACSDTGPEEVTAPGK